MPHIAHPALLAAGLITFLIGVWFWRWSSRNAIDVKGAALGAAWQGVKSGRVDVPDDLKQKYEAIANEKSNVRRAGKAGGTVVRHFIAQVFGLIGIAGMLGGLGLAAAGIWWK
jgi:hypothetical protein